MEFDSNRPIYLQILDAICDQILEGTLQPDGRIPSVRDYGAQLGVNPNTIMRSYEKLTNDGIIYNIFPKIRHQMELLGIGPEIFNDIEIAR